MLAGYITPGRREVKILPEIRYLNCAQLIQSLSLTRLLHLLYIEMRPGFMLLDSQCWVSVGFVFWCRFMKHAQAEFFLPYYPVYINKSESF